MQFRSLISSPYFEEPLTDGPIEHDYSISSDFFPASHHESVAPFQVSFFPFSYVPFFMSSFIDFYHFFVDHPKY